MKKMLISLLTIGVVGTAGYLGYTGAFFSDTETSESNVFTAGSVTLAIEEIVHQFTGEGPTQPIFTPTNQGFSFSLTDLKPLDEGMVTYNLRNGENEAYVCAMVEEKTNDENIVLDPEIEAGDTADDGSGFGELGDFLSFKFGTQTGTLQNISGLWQTVGTVAANAVQASAMEYCFGVFDGANCVLGAADDNLAQTDSLTADIKFYAVQTRNNSAFNCSDLNVVNVGNNDLFSVYTPKEGLGAVINLPNWFFYNDTDDSVMSPNQFNGTSGANAITALTGTNGAAFMKLDTSGAPRYNIATYQFKDVKLATISSIKYRINDMSVSSETPYLHFNVDFANNDSWQRRLVQVPTGIVANTLTEVDALTGMWNLSGGDWPVGVNTVAPFAGSTLRTWADITADYPNAETRSTDSFFGVRVGHPGPAGEEGYVDWIEFDGVKYDFVN